MHIQTTATFSLSAPRWSQTSSSNLWASSLCGLPVFELTVQGGLSFLTGLVDLKLRRLPKAPHKSKWDHTRSHRGKVLEWSIIYCNSEIIFPTDMFGFLTCLLRISFQNCYLFVSHLLHCFLSKSSWSILTKIWKLARLSVTGLPTDLQDTAWESDHFSSLTGGPNRPLRCLDGSEVRPCEGNLKMLEAGICRDLQRLVCKYRC